MATALQLPGYRKLKVRQKAFDLAVLIQELSDGFPPGNYRLSDQMRGAAISVFGNIAEGYTQGAIGSYIRHCEIARGSLGELIVSLRKKRQAGDWDRSYGVEE